MRIPIFYNPINKSKKHLHIERVFISKKELIPLGCDCHPAYILQKLHLRKQSLPFDWLNNSSILSIEYVNDNLSKNFEFFLKDLMLNEKKNVVAKKYFYCEFLHEPKLIESIEDRNKFKRRVSRFLSLKESKDIHYLNNITSHSLISEKIIEDYIFSVNEFANKHLKKNDLLSIYIRFDESFKENEQLTNKLERELNKIEKVCCVKYIRHHSKYPTWGNPKYYPKLLKDLGVEIKETLPKIFIKTSF